jgi:hypothetical protein
LLLWQRDLVPNGSLALDDRQRVTVRIAHEQATGKTQIA